MRKLAVVWSASLLFLATACQTDKPKTTVPPEMQAKLTGKWEITGGVNQKDASPLDRFNGAVFEFTADGKFISSLKGLETDEFQLSRDSVKLKSQPQVALTIGTVNDSALSLVLGVQDYHYELNLKRK